VTQLICVDFKCDFPTPENMAKKGGFALPGGCTSMQECAEYCAKPANNLDCLKFCDEFPSFCSEEARGARASEAPAECRACTSCAAKNCILDCVFKCFNYVPFAQEDVAALKRGVVFERRFQSPVKGVWEPGPAYNRIGVTYFVDDYKALGVNAYSVTPKYSHDENKQLIHTIDRAIGGAADNETIGNVIKAKKAGLQVVLVAHDLYDLFPDANSNKGERVRAEDYSTQLEETALKWARVAEEYKAEYFVPVNEFEYVLYENGYSAEEACAATNALYARVIPRVREIFKGKIYCRVGGMDAKFACMNFSQCDVFGFTYGFSGSAYQTNFRALFQAGETAFSRCNKPYFMAESFCLKVRGQTDADCVKLHEAGISEFKATAAHGTGFFFMGLIQNDPINKNSFPIIDTALEDEYKAFFKWMDENKA
jgi:hypothetical protein